MSPHFTHFDFTLSLIPSAIIFLASEVYEPCGLLLHLVLGPPSSAGYFLPPDVFPDYLLSEVPPGHIFDRFEKL